MPGSRSERAVEALPDPALVDRLLRPTKARHREQSELGITWNSLRFRYNRDGPNPADAGTQIMISVGRNGHCSAVIFAPECAGSSHLNEEDRPVVRVFIQPSRV